MSQTNFQQLFEKNIEQLNLYTTAITRAHGESHPEAFDVRELFETIHEKMQEADESNPELDEQFTQLRKLTNNYEVPSDVCETYASVYKMLAELDESYQTK